MARYLNNQKYQRRYLGNTKLKKKYLGETNIWSGGSVVSYFDGETLLTTKEIDEGSDVLHVSVSSKNLIPYPYSNSNKTSNGITWTVTNDGYITATGTATSDSWFDVISNSKNYFLPSGSYRVTGCPTGGDATKYGIWVTHGASLANYVRDYGEGENFTITSATAQETFRVVIGIRQGQTVNNLTFKPMVVNASVYPDTEYGDFVKFGMYKEGYTHIGWTGYGGTEIFEEKVATGEPMSLYALFIPNTLVVARGSIRSVYNSSYRGWNFYYTSESVESNYVTGSVVSTVSSTYQALTNTATFTLNKRYYQTADLQLLFGNDGSANENCAFDGTRISHSASASVDTKTYNDISNGNHTITSAIYATGDLKECTIGIGTLTLSNPTQWV